MRVGLGVDFHRLRPGRRLVLGGVEIPFELGLIGHSDADVLLHAICDALLGAAGLGDIGHFFPPEDEEFRDIASSELLGRVRTFLFQAGYAPVGVDAVVVAEAPKLAPYIPAMRDRIAQVLGIPSESISVKATTSEGMGAIGRGEGIGAFAVALIEKVAIDPDK